MAASLDLSGRVKGCPWDTWTLKDDSVLITSWREHRKRCFHPGCPYHGEPIKRLDRATAFRDHWRLWHLEENSLFSFQCMEVLGDKRCTASYKAARHLTRHLEVDHAENGAMATYLVYMSR